MAYNSHMRYFTGNGFILYSVAVKPYQVHSVGFIRSEERKCPSGEGCFALLQAVRLGATKG